MKKELLGSTALIGATALIAGVAGAAEAPTWKLTGNANFQFYYVDSDNQGSTSTSTWTNTGGFLGGTWSELSIEAWDTTATGQDHSWYFGVDEAELQLNVSGTADNGLNYGFKIEINALTTDDTAADEVRLQLSGGWGTVQMGDEDGAEDIMNYGGENLMGATGGFDGDQDDYLYRTNKGFGDFTFTATSVNSTTTVTITGNALAPGYPTIAGDTSDHTKVSYFSPRFSGFQVGASITPTVSMDGDEFKADGGGFEDHIGLGANYDNSFGDLRIRASAVYSTASSTSTGIEDIGAWSVGGILGWGPFSLGANYTDNSDSGENVGSDFESSYWNVAASFETGPMYFSAGYLASTREFGVATFLADSTYEHIALTADYTVAPGLGVYAEVNLISDEMFGGSFSFPGVASINPAALSNDTTSLILGANVSF